MKAILILIAIALLPLTLAAQTAQPADLKSAVAGWFRAETRVNQTDSMVTLSAVLDNRVSAKENASLRATWAKYSGQWRAELIGLAKVGTASPQDRAILADMRAAHNALEESEKDRAKIDEAVRRLQTLRQRVGG